MAVRPVFRPVARRRAPRRGEGLAASALLAGVLLAVFLLWFNRQLRPVLEAMAEAEVRNAVTAAINDAITEGIAQRDVSYDEMVTVETDESGRVTALKSNMGRANLLRSQLLEAALEEVSGLSEQDFAIPLGNLLGLDFLSGRGPEVKVRVLSAGAAGAAFQNHFSSAGVNQTLHQIVLEISVTVRILLPGRSLETAVSTAVCVAQTVIVGQVPDTYLQLERGA